MLLPCLDSVFTTVSKMQQSAGYHKESRVCTPVMGLNASAQYQAVHCNAAVLPCCTSQAVLG